MFNVVLNIDHQNPKLPAFKNTHSNFTTMNYDDAIDNYLKS